MTKLKMSIGRTYNLGNYESLRLDVGIEDELSEFHERIVNPIDCEAIYGRLKELLASMEKDQGIGGK